MKKSRFRIIAALLLVVTLLTLSGLTSTAATLLQVATANSCCDSGCDDPPAAGPCSTPDCPCFSCISMIAAYPPTILRDGAGVLLSHGSPQPLHLSEYAPSIEYPPETA